MPDYQGIGLGIKFLTIVAKYYRSLDFDVLIVTSARNVIMSLNKHDSWSLTRFGVVKVGENADKGLNKTLRKVKTASFFMK